MSRQITGIEVHFEDTANNGRQTFESGLALRRTHVLSVRPYVGAPRPVDAHPLTRNDGLLLSVPFRFAL